MSQFQSHNGAIAALTHNLFASLKALFQSHNGAIAAENRSFANLKTRSFNPTMVRLLLAHSLPQTK